MALGWTRQAFLTDWQGLFSRRQSIDVGAAYASVARNIDFFGSAIGKRLGTQLVNGWGTVALAGWANSPNGTGKVIDATGFAVTSVVNWRNPDTTFGSGTVASVNYGTNTLTLTAPAGVLPQSGAVFWAVYAGGLGSGRIDGLFHAVYRDGNEHLIAAASGAGFITEQLVDVWGGGIVAGASYLPGALTDRATPLGVNWTTVDVNWGSTTLGTLTTTETIVATDGSINAGVPTPPFTFLLPPNDLTPTIITIISPGGVFRYEGTIMHVAGRTITLTAAAFSNPQAGDFVWFFPHRTAGDTRFAQAANETHVTSAAGVNPVATSVPSSSPSVGGVSVLPAVQRTPPVKVFQLPPLQRPPDVVVYRHGIKAPTTPPGVSPAGIVGSGNIQTSFATWRYKYRNSVTEQESEPSSFSTPPMGLTNQNASVVLQGSPDPQVDKIRIYRSPSNTSGTWYFVGEVNNPGAGANTTFTDTIAEPPSGPVMREFLDLTVPDTCTQLVYWPQAVRMVGIDAANQTVIISDGPDPTVDPVTNTRGRLKLESFPADNVLFVNRDDGDKLTAVAAFFDAVLIFKGHSVWRLIGTPPDIVVQPVIFRDDQTAVGAWGPKAIAVDQDQMVFGGDDGLYGVSRSEGLATGFSSDRISRPIDDEWIRRVIQTQVARVHMIFTRLRRQLRIFLPVDAHPSNEPSECFVYQFDSTADGQPNGWAEWSPPAIFTHPGDNTATLDTTASCVVRQGSTFPVAYYGRADGTVLKADQPIGHDAGNPYQVEYETVWFAPQGGGGDARGRAIDTLWILDAASFARPNQAAPVLQVAADFASAGQVTALLNLLAPVVPQNQRGIVFARGQYHRLGFQEQDVTSLYRLLTFTYLYQSQPLTVADRSNFVQNLG